MALVCFLAGLIADHDGCAARHRRVEVVGAVETAALRLSEAGERNCAGRRRDRGTPGGLRAYGRRWPLGVQHEVLSDGLVSVFVPGAPDPAFRGGLSLFNGQRSTSRRQAGRWAQLPQAMRRGRMRARRRGRPRRSAA